MSYFVYACPHCGAVIEVCHAPKDFMYKCSCGHLLAKIRIDNCMENELTGELEIIRDRENNLLEAITEAQANLNAAQGDLIAYREELYPSYKADESAGGV